MPQVSALRPVLLRPDNFTPPARTPWGGRRITGHYKAGLGLAPELRQQAVGEAWELSFGPELPSRTLDGRLLHELVKDDPQAYLGAEAALGASALLVKWLDAADELSVQIHPSVDDPALGADEPGTPECWYIAACEPNAGIYLGLQPGVSAAAMRSALETGADVSALLRFRAVTPGDFYLLQPGLPHAVGRGVTLVEPQYVAPGKKGLTLRYWDWNRRYDAAGNADPKGRPRELHVERALHVTDWALAGDSTWLAQQCTALGAADCTAPAGCELLCDALGDAPVRSRYLRAARLSGSGRVRLPNWDTLSALTVIEGSVVLHGDFDSVRVERGSTAAIPAALSGLECELLQGHALLSSVVGTIGTVAAR
jgi:mannose-6-phosphate isomerase class I